MINILKVRERMRYKMDIGFRSYLVLKIISLVEGKWEHSRVLMLLKDNGSYNIKPPIENLDFMNLWRAFYTIPAEEIEKIINNLIQTKVLCIKPVQMGENRYSMLFITSKGKKILYRLDKKYYPIINKYTFMDTENPDIIKERPGVTYMVSNYKLSQAF